MFAFFNQGQEVDLAAPLPAEAETYAQAKRSYDVAHAPFVAAIVEFKRSELPDRQAAWEKDLDKSSLPTWTTLEPVSIAATGSAKFAGQPDGSYLVAGENKPVETYTLQIKANIQGITAFRLEVLPDATLPAQGPGRVAHGNFVLSEFKATVTSGAGAAQPVEFAAASADFAQPQFPAQAAIDGDIKTGWAVASQFGQRHVAVFETKTNLDLTDDSLLTIVLDQQHGTQHTIGKFRLSATTMSRPVKLEGVSAEINTILATAAEQRTAAEQAKLTAFYAPLDAELSKLIAAEAEHAKQSPPLPATKRKRWPRSIHRGRHTSIFAEIF